MGKITMLLSKGPLQRQWLNAIVNIVMLVLSACILVYLVGFSVEALFAPSHFTLSEFTINYEGGFVRRGLLGQLIYQACSLTGCNPLILIAIICGASFTFVLGFIIRQFIRYDICWWILPTSYIFSSAYICVIRKDFMVISLFILALHLYQRNNWKPWIRLMSLSLLVTIMILIYEAIGFLTLPIVALLVLNDRSYRAPLPMRWIALLVPVVAMLACSLCHGDAATASAIHQSWLPWEGQMIPGEYHSLSLWALSWTVADSLQFNESILLGTHLFGWLPKLLYRIASLALILYIGCRYMKVMSRHADTGFSAIFVIIFLCMTPLWLGLSCDYGRLSMQLFIVVFVTYRYLPRSITPQWITSPISRINAVIDRIIPSHPATITLLLLFTGLAPTFFFFNNLWRFSAIGELIQFFTINTLSIF